MEDFDGGEVDFFAQLSRRFSLRHDPQRVELAPLTAVPHPRRVD
jgi:hypothetical protein